jgi:hypothetical protein
LPRLLDQALTTDRPLIKSGSLGAALPAVSRNFGRLLQQLRTGYVAAARSRKESTSPWYPRCRPVPDERSLANQALLLNVDACRQDLTPAFP